MGYLEETNKQRITNGLCKKCGKCCRLTTNLDYSYRELKRQARHGNTEALEFISIFTPYETIDEAKKIDSYIVEAILELATKKGLKESDITFYKCKYILDNNKCSIYEERPEFCRNRPKNGWEIMPSSCGYNAWMFEQREANREEVRKAKEKSIDLKLMRKNTTDPIVLKKIISIEKRIRTTLESFSQYGSADW